MRDPILPREEGQEGEAPEQAALGPRGNTTLTLRWVLVGQLLAFLVCCTGIFSKELARRGVNLPTTQNLCVYATLTTVFGSVLAYKRLNESSTSGGGLQFAWWKYALLALIDVQANFVVVKAYHYTNFTSVQLLDCASIPAVMVLSHLVLRVTYRTSHYVGAVSCLSGLGALVISDVLRSSGGNLNAPDPLRGDLLVLVGASLYAVSNVGQEFTVMRVENVEWLTMLGAWGTFWSVLQVLLVEREAVSAAIFDAPEVQWANVGLFAGFTATLALFYALTPMLLVAKGAAFFNLSLLTADVWALVVGALLFQESIQNWLYLLGFVLIVAGIVVYNRTPLEYNTPELETPAEREALAPRTDSSYTHQAGDGKRP